MYKIYQLNHVRISSHACVNDCCFSNTFHKVNAEALYVWKFQRYSLVIEYEGKPILPPPFIIVCHVYLILRYIVRRCRCKPHSFDNALSKCAFSV